MPHLLTAMINIPPGAPVAYAFMALATLTTIATVIIIKNKAQRQSRENGTARRSASGDGSTAALGGYAATDSRTDCGTDAGGGDGGGADGGGGGGGD